MTTHTRVHTLITFANPYLACSLCQQPVPRWHNPSVCGCGGHIWNAPCGHGVVAASSCPTWSPADGCTCQPRHTPPAQEPS